MPEKQPDGSFIFEIDEMESLLGVVSQAFDVLNAFSKLDVDSFRDTMSKASTWLMIMQECLDVQEGDQSDG